MNGRGTVRIIGGNWRSRKVSFPDRAGIRPTPDRVRETLFNWLQPHIAGSRCLELYAGSGVLSMEALSRAARHATLVEQDRETCHALDANLSLLGADVARYSCVNASALDFLASDRCRGPWDLVFLDPPFAGSDLKVLLPHLLANDLLSEEALVYLETPAAILAEDLPAGLIVHRQNKAGAVHYCLVGRHEAI